MASAPADTRRPRGLRALSLVTLAAPLLVLPVLGAIGCYDFTYDEPAKEAGAGDATPPDGESDACVVAGSYCGGDRVVGATDTLYVCAADGGGTLLKRCASGCTPDAGNGAGAICKPPSAPCQVGGNYCGGDKLDGDPRVLYRCVAGGAHTILERCTKDCRVAPAGSDDACLP